jgi:hypothetical protein
LNWTLISLLPRQSPVSALPGQRSGIFRYCRQLPLNQGSFSTVPTIPTIPIVNNWIMSSSASEETTSESPDPLQSGSLKGRNQFWLCRELILFGLLSQTKILFGSFKK